MSIKQRIAELEAKRVAAIRAGEFKASSEVADEMRSLARPTYYSTYEYVRRHASENYDKDGWDFFIECVGFNDFIYDLLEFDMFEHSQERILQHYTKVMKLQDERRNEVLNEIF